MANFINWRLKELHFWNELSIVSDSPKINTTSVFFRFVAMEKTSNRSKNYWLGAENEQFVGRGLQKSGPILNVTYFCAVCDCLLLRFIQQIFSRPSLIAGTTFCETSGNKLLVLSAQSIFFGSVGSFFHRHKPKKHAGSIYFGWIRLYRPLISKVQLF